MPERTESKAVERSCRLYHRLLMFYPKAHREEYGAPMLQLFRDQCRDAWTSRRTRGLIVCWLRVLPDLLKTLALEHLSNLNWRKSMLFRTQFRPLAVFLSVFTAVFVLTVLTSAVIAFLMPDRFRSTAQIVVDENRLGSAQSIFHTDPPMPRGEMTVVADSSGASNFQGGPLYPQTEFAVIRCHAVLSKVVTALNLRDVWGKKFNNGQPLKESDAEGIILRNLELQPIRNTKVIEISACSDSPDEAARLANGVTEAYRAYSVDVAKLEASHANDGAMSRARMVTIIQPAVGALRPFRPNRPLMITLGLMLGSVFGSIAGAASVGVVTLFGRGRNPTASNANWTRETITGKSN
jgi:capsular polysaccharide biosynthesis protein